ncbi:phospho-N-acetylmuramoyl-pentapeptide-transferase [Helicobacter sp. 23-1044]
MLYQLYAVFGINIFQYLSFRAGIAFIVAFLLCVILYPKFIAWAKLKCASQPISNALPIHKIKANTPTMGGVVFVGVSIFVTLLCADFVNVYVALGIFTMGLFCIVGMKDDYTKITQKSNAGLTSRAKFVALLLLSLALALILFLANHNTHLYVPFLKNPIFDMGYFAIVFWAVVLVSTSNAVNITDGLDGLATMPSIFAITTLSIFVWLAGNAVFSSYLFLPKIIGAGELFIVSSALLGALFGFLWYNCYPAQVFMGDSGSLAIGGFIAYMGIVTNNEILLIFTCFIFVVETLSVILQVGSYKVRKKRIFLMSPIHHHFEVKGWSENKIIIRFWIIALLSNLLALLSLKIR